ncbi:MAG TPA: PEGA domain-containing protein [Candidatus Paceibacterota bacterium]|nr:PEGA domain-containing protein [Candidatus Paceibacterota bacterium]
MKAPPVESLSSRLKRHWLLLLVMLFVAALLCGYAAGFRPGPGLTVVRVGTLEVAGIPPGTTVYTDLASRGMAGAAAFTVPLVPGTHTVIISAPNDEPFERTVSITSNQTTVLSPILVPQKPTPLVLDGDAAATANTSIAKAIMPTQTSPLAIGCASVYVLDNRVIAAPATSTPECAAPPEYMCTNDSCAPTLAYAPTTPIRSVIPFPGRTDAVIVATGPSVNVVGLDPRYPQYFAPVIKATSPAIGEASTTGFYISDLGKTYFIGL